MSGLIVVVAMFTIEAGVVVGAIDWLGDSDVLGSRKKRPTTPVNEMANPHNRHVQTPNKLRAVKRIALLLI